MKIKSKFAIYNIIMLITPILLIGVFCADIYIKISCRRIKYIKTINA